MPVARCEGTGGWIEVEGPWLTVHRTDSRFAVAPRVLPCQALSHATIKDASRLRRGHLQLWFGATVLVPVGSDEDPNMIGFNHEQREAFRACYEYLWGVIRTNEAGSVDVAAVYQAANDPLVAWLADRERAREQEAAASARQAEEQELHRIEKLAGKIGPIAAARQDILNSAVASATGERCWLAIKRLPDLLLGGEQVFVVAECFLGTNLGTAVLTNLRLMFVRTGFSGDQVDALPLRDIAAVTTSQKLTKGALHVQASVGLVEFSGVRMEDLQRLDEALRLAVGRYLR